MPEEEATGTGVDDLAINDLQAIALACVDQAGSAVSVRKWCVLAVDPQASQRYIGERPDAGAMAKRQVSLPLTGMKAALPDWA